MPASPSRILVQSASAGQIANPLSSAMVLSPEDDAASGATEMAARQFDSAPVLADGMPVGVFQRQTNAEIEAHLRVDELMRPFSADMVVSGQTTLGQLMERLENQDFLFVIDDVAITGFITPADLGTIPVRTHFYLRLARLESLLCQGLRIRYAEQMDAISLLSPSRQRSHAKIASDLRAKDKFIDDLACLSLDDLVTIAGKDAGFRVATKDAGIGWTTATRGLADFRNDIMHPGRPFTCAADSRPKRLLARQRGLDALIEATLQNLLQERCAAATR